MKIPSRLTAFFLLICLCLLANYDQGLLNLETVLKNAKNANLTAFPDATNVLLDDYEHTEYQPDGTYVTWDDAAVKILTDKGREEYSYIQMGFNVSYGIKEITLLQIIDENGKITNLPAAHLSQVVTDNSNMGSNIYDPNNKQLIIRVPDLRVNHIVRYVAKYTEFKNRIKNTFADMSLLEYTAPIMHYRIDVLAPPELPLKKIEILDKHGDTVSYRSENSGNDSILHIWEANNVPQIHTEPKMPSLWSCGQRVAFSTIQNWEELSKWYWNLCLPHLKTTPEIQQKVQELIKNAKNDDEKIRAIFTFVSQEIRYMGETTETEAPGYEPHDVAATFNKRHGVCRDKAALLTAMLREAGFKAYPVLIHVGDHVSPQVPMSHFNHAITAIERDGDFQLMDSTNENTKALLPEYLVNRSYMVAHPEGQPLRISAVNPAEENLLDISTIGDIDIVGTLHARSFIRFLGLNDTRFRGLFAQESPDFCHAWLQSRISASLGNNVQLLNYVVTPKNAMNTAEPLTLELQYTITDVMNSKGDDAFFFMPSLAAFDISANSLRKDLVLQKRRFPLMTRYPFVTNEHVSITVHPRWGKITPPISTTSATTDEFEWSRTVSIENNTIDLDSKLKLSAVQFSAEQYKTLREQIFALDSTILSPFRASAETPRTMTPPAADATFIKTKTTINVKDKNTWTTTCYVKKQILTYAGKEDSEIIINYIPQYQSAKIDFVRVYNDGQLTELDTKENKIMDPDWVGMAPRYTPGKILVANMPAVEIGSVVEFQYTVTSQDFNDFTHTTFFRGKYPIQFASLTVQAPKSLQMDITVSQNGLLMDDYPRSIKESVSENGDFITRTWSTEMQEAIQIGTNKPSGLTYIPFVHCSVGSYKEKIAEFKTAFLKNAVADDAIKELAAKYKDLPPKQKLVEIRNFITKYIRTAEPGPMTFPVDQLSPASVVFKDQYGINADVAILFYTVLKEAGFSPEVYLVLPQQPPNLAKKIDAMYMPDSIFDVILSVKCDGMTIWLNDTDEYAEPGTCLYENFPAYTLDGKKLRISVPELYRPKVVSKLDIDIHDDGSADIALLSKSYGQEGNVLRKSFSRATPYDKKQTIDRILYGIAPTAVLTEDAVIDYEGYPVINKFKFRIPNFAKKQADGSIQFYSLAEFSNFISNGLPGRKDPIVQNKSNNTYIMDVTIRLPQNISKIISMPQTFDIRLPNSDTRMKLQVNVSKNTIRIHNSEEHHLTAWPPELYPELLEINRKLTSPANTLFIIK